LGGDNPQRSLKGYTLMDWKWFVLNSLFTGVLLYIIQKVFDERASRRLEQLKTDLRLAAFERETRFAKFHERQADVIAELYKRLAQIQSNLRSFAHAIDSDTLNYTKGEKDKAAAESVEAFWDYFQEHRIYLPKTLGERIEQFYQQSTSAYVNLSLADLSQFASDIEPDQEKYREKNLAEASRILADKISPVRDDIEQELRKLLGG
jgi:hypothetical protein